MSTRAKPALPMRSADRHVRSDALPEYQEYHDDGCDLFASCLACPLRRCRYDVPGGVRALLNRERDHQIRVMRDTSALSIDEIAARFRMSRRTVFRALQLRGACGVPEAASSVRAVQTIPIRTIQHRPAVPGKQSECSDRSA